MHPRTPQIAGVAGFILLLLAYFSTVIIPPGYRGIVVRLGSVRGELSPGFHLKLPLLDGVKKVDNRTTKQEVEASAASKDLQDVQTTVALTYRIDPGHVSDVYQTVGIGGGVLTQTVIVPTIQESVKATTAQFTAEELVTNREVVKEKMRSAIRDRLAPYFLVVEDVSIVNFKFSEAFEQAIEQKVAAEQQALAAKNKLEQVKFEAQQQVETAKAQAESIRIQADALKQNQDLIRLKAVEKWDGKLPGTMVPGGSLPFLNLQ